MAKRPALSIPDSLDLLEVIGKADRFVAVAFRGRGVYERVEAATLSQARVAARSLWRGRPVGIYAVARDVRGATLRSRHVENWEPV
jgi:hypothetical protein